MKRCRTAKSMCFIWVCSLCEQGEQSWMPEANNHTKVSIRRSFVVGRWIRDESRRSKMIYAKLGSSLHLPFRINVQTQISGRKFECDCNGWRDEASIGRNRNWVLRKTLTQISMQKQSKHITAYAACVEPGKANELQCCNNIWWRVLCRDAGKVVAIASNMANVVSSKRLSKTLHQILNLLKKPQICRT